SATTRTGMTLADDVRLVPLLLRPEEVATVLRVGRTRVYELMRSGDLRSVKIGHLRRRSATAVAEYVARLDAA
ncbi:MAG TPA: helix-turn-helix domain-containing protein, partial [Kribbellaceae bacterium]